MLDQNIVRNLNNSSKDQRLLSLKKISNMNGLDFPIQGSDVNNHIHTTYSFSPYSPSKAIYMARKAGLCTAGIMDHDSIGGAEEFIEAGKIMGIATTIGVECRVSFAGTPLFTKKINNPDQTGIAYVAIHGVPHTQIPKVKEFFAPYLKFRNIRNAAMIDKINTILNKFSINIDYEKDVVPLSSSDEGGSITERHLLYAMALKLIDRFGKGILLLQFLRNKLKLDISPKIEGYLIDSSNQYYDYDLLGFLKSSFIDSFYIDATDECPNVTEIVNFAHCINAILAYAYLGDVGASVTGDKKSQKFEDSYLKELFVQLKALGFNAVTYMPSRNTPQQFSQINALCKEYDFLQISGEDINSPRQPFICENARDEKFNNLYDSTWALIGHEIAATKNLEDSMFSSSTLKKHPCLLERIEIYKQIGLKLGIDQKRGESDYMRMFAVERHNKILSILGEKKSILVSEIAPLFDVAEETVRRDLAILEGKGLLLRTHGGAVLYDNLLSETPYTIREGINTKGKSSMGKKAAELVNDGDIILLDGSSSALYVAKNIKDKKGLTVISNGQRIIMELAECKDITLISIGGIFRYKSLSFVGPTAESVLSNYHASKVFFSCSGFSPKTGLTDSNEQEAAVKRAMMNSSAQTIFLCDCTKFDRLGYSIFAQLQNIDTIITDAAIPEDWIVPLENASVTAIVT